MSQPDDLQPVDRLIAIEEISRVKARYFRLMDQKRWSEWADVFTADCTFDIAAQGQVESTLKGRDEIVSTFGGMLENGQVLHHGHMPEIDITSPTTASARWSYEYYGNLGSDELVRIWGTYDEQMRKEADGRWRLAHVFMDRLRTDPA